MFQTIIVSHRTSQKYKSLITVEHFARAFKIQMCENFRNNNVIQSTFHQYKKLILKLILNIVFLKVW